MPDLRPRRSRDEQHGYGLGALGGDLSGGLIAALVALPYGLALARLMGLPPEFGLYTSILTAPVTALLGRNPVLIGGTASATVPFIAEAVRTHGPPGAAKICLAASVFMLIFSVLRLGRRVIRAPHVVISGFSCGVGAMMVILQLRTMLGLTGARAGASSNPLVQLGEITLALPQARLRPLILALVVVSCSFFAARRWPRSPAALAGVSLAALLAATLGWHERSLGSVGLDLPPLASFTWSAEDVRNLLPSAIGLAFVTSINILITSRVVEHFQGRHRPLRAADADAELGAYGIANIVSGAFGVPMSVGIPARSLANVRCGGSTRLSNFSHAVFLYTLVRFGSPLLGIIPLAALAGVTTYVGIGLLEWSTWRRLHQLRRLDAAAFLATALAVLATNAVAAVAIGWTIHAAGRLLDQLAPRIQTTLAKTSPNAKT